MTDTEYVLRSRSEGRSFPIDTLLGLISVNAGRCVADRKRGEYLNRHAHGLFTFMPFPKHNADRRSTRRR